MAGRSEEEEEINETWSLRNGVCVKKEIEN